MRNIEIIHEDDHIIAINKVAGMLSIPDRFNKDIVNLYGLLQRSYDQVYTVHRLDKQTSGVIIFAKTEKAHRALSKAFEDRKPTKTYLAIVDGIPTQKEGEIIKPIIESKTKRGSFLVSNKGKDSHTKYKVIEDLERFSVLEVEILTGRTHQIRVHLNSINHPLIVDSLYGQREFFLLSEIKRRKYNRKTDKEEKPLLERQALHSHKLAIDLKEDGFKYDLEAPLPKDMRAVLNQMRKIYK